MIAVVGAAPPETSGTERSAAPAARSASPAAASPATILAESSSHPGTFHTLTMSASGRWACTCKGYQIRHRCHHVAEQEDLFGDAWPVTAPIRRTSGYTSSMQIFTSYFARSSRHPQAVSICRYPPRGWTGKRVISLAPSAGLLGAAKRGLAEAPFKERYLREVSRLDPVQVAAQLGEGAVLLCFEKSSESYCHRHYLAEWLMSGVPDLTVTELP